MVLRGDGSVVAWGCTPIPAGLTNISGIAAGYYFSVTMMSNGNPGLLNHHVDAESLVLIDAEGREYARGTDFDVRVEQMSSDTLRYSVDFNEHVCFQPVGLRFLLTRQFFEKALPFEFKDVPLS